MNLSKLFYLLIFVLFSCSNYTSNEDNFKLESSKLKLTVNETYSNVIKIESLNESGELSFSFNPYPNEKINIYNDSVLEYCINILEFDAPITYNSNYLLLNFEDFNCTNSWKSYEQIDTSLTLSDGKEYILNIALRNNNKIYLYNRLIVSNQIDLLAEGTTCEELVLEFYDNNKIVLRGDIDCKNVEIESASEIVSNLYFNANGYSIFNIFINGVNNNYTGLIGKITNNSYIANLNIQKSTLIANSNVGLLIGWAQDSSIENINSIGSASGVFAVGGLIGSLFNSLLINSSFSGLVNSSANGNFIGGLVGLSENSKLINDKSEVKLIATDSIAGGLVGYLNQSSIEDSSSKADISAKNMVGGLVGNSNYSTIKNSFSKGSVTTLSNQAGGLVGYLNNSDLENTYSNSNVYGGTYEVGGLVGQATLANIENSYATGNVEGILRVGGFVGLAIDSSISASYSAVGEVNGTNFVNGFVGLLALENILTNNYTYRADDNTNGLTVLTEEEFSNVNNFIGFDFENVWFINLYVPAYVFIRPQLMFEK